MLLHASDGYGPDFLDVVQLVQRYLKDVGIEADVKLQEYGAYLANTAVGKYEGLAMGSFPPDWEPAIILTGAYPPDQSRNRGHVNDPMHTVMIEERRRTKDLTVRQQRIFDIQRYAAAPYAIRLADGGGLIRVLVCEVFRNHALSLSTFRPTAVRIYPS
jgi:ABC-type transport system substrate-binding protein